MSDSKISKRTFSDLFSESKQKRSISVPNLPAEDREPNLEHFSDSCSNNQAFNVKKVSSSRLFSCSECSKKYRQFRNLKIHFSRCHPSKILNLETAKPKLDRPKSNYQCEMCSRQFKYRKHLLYHERKEHSKFSMVLNWNHKCAFCSASFAKNELIAHYKSDHDASIETEELQFSSFNDFIKWKEEMEKNTFSKFSQSSGKQQNKAGSRFYYQCHRSGFYKPRGNNQRHLKVQGSRKIQGLCPASLKVFEKNGMCTVHFLKTHIGHTHDLVHLELTANEKETIAAQIAARVPFDAILDSIRYSVSDSTLTRLQLLTRKDLHNIEKSFNITSDAHHKDDEISIRDWIKAMQEGSNSCILFYKPQGIIINGFPTLAKDDFVLAIMNEPQSEMLTNFGSDTICIDRTRDLNNYGYELITILVIDDMRQGFPCSFLISNRIDLDILSIFLSYIKEKIGTIKPGVLITDVAECFFNAWQQTMDPPKLRLFCAWHVDCAWRESLKKIHGKQKQLEVYQILHALMQESDSKAFEMRIQEISKRWSEDEDMIDFYDYFARNYANNVECWAHSYRLQSGENTNMHIERLHRTIKHIYLHKKNSRNLHKAVHGIMKFVRVKLVDRLIIRNKGKIASKLKDLQKRHDNSKCLTFDMLNQNENGWNFVSSNGKEMFTIEEVKRDCSCEIICSDCNACIHKYTCTCTDSSVRWNMCKHIHLVCTSLKSNREDLEENTLRDFLHWDVNDSIQVDDEILQQIKIIEVCTVPLILSEEKEKLKEELFSIIDSVTTIDALENVKELIASMRTSIAASHSINKSNGKS